MVMRGMRTTTRLRILALVGVTVFGGSLVLQTSGCFLPFVAKKFKKKPTPTATPSPSSSPTPVPAAMETPLPDANLPHQTVAHIVASVDGEPITTRDVEQFSAAVGHPVNANDIAGNEEAKAALKALISEKLLEKEVDQYASKVEEEQIDNYKLKHFSF